MPLEENKEVVRRFVEAYNNQDFDSLDDLLAPDYFDKTNQQKGERNLTKKNGGFDC